MLTTTWIELSSGSAFEAFGGGDVHVEAAALAHSDGLDGYGFNFIRGVPVHEPVAGLSDALGIEIELVAVREISGLDVLTERFTSHAAVADEREHVERHYAGVPVGQRVHVTFETGKAGQRQLVARHLLVVGPVEAQLSGKFAERPGLLTLAIAHDLRDFDLLDRG